MEISRAEEAGFDLLRIKLVGFYLSLHNIHYLIFVEEVV